MKYIHTTIVFLFLLNSIHSQPTITSDWFYSIGDSILTAYYYPDSNMEPSEGINITWDISNAPDPYGDREIIMINPTELDYSDEFPDATLGYKQSMEREYYLNIEGGNLQFIGLRTPDFKRVYANGFPIIAYDDFSYGDTETVSYNTIAINVQNMDTTLYNDVDELSFAGFGTVITPEGTFENCVMTKLTRTSTGSSDLIEYKFHKDKLANTIASYLVYTGGGVEPSKKIEYRIDQIVSTKNELAEGKIKITRPGEHSIFINSQSEIDARIQIIDIAGHIIFDQSKEIISGDNEIRIDQFRKANIYFLLIMDKNTGSFQTYKFQK